MNTFLTPAQSAAITLDYLLTALNRYGVMSLRERAEFWKHAVSSSLSTEDINRLSAFLSRGA